MSGEVIDNLVWNSQNNVLFMLPSGMKIRRPFLTGMEIYIYKKKCFHFCNNDLDLTNLFALTIPRMFK